MLRTKTTAMSLLFLTVMSLSGRVTEAAAREQADTMEVPVAVPMEHEAIGKRIEALMQKDSEVETLLNYIENFTWKNSEEYHKLEKKHGEAFSKALERLDEKEMWNLDQEENRVLTKNGECFIFSPMRFPSEEKVMGVKAVLDSDSIEILNNSDVDHMWRQVEDCSEDNVLVFFGNEYLLYKLGVDVFANLRVNPSALSSTKIFFTTSHELATKFNTRAPGVYLLNRKLGIERAFALGDEASCWAVVQLAKFTPVQTLNQGNVEIAVGSGLPVVVLVQDVATDEELESYGFSEVASEVLNEYVLGVMKKEHVYVLSDYYRLNNVSELVIISDKSKYYVNWWRPGSSDALRKMLKDHKEGNYPSYEEISDKVLFKKGMANNLSSPEEIQQVLSMERPGDSLVYFYNIESQESIESFHGFPVIDDVAFSLRKYSPGINVYKISKKTIPDSFADKVAACPSVAYFSKEAGKHYIMEGDISKKHILEFVFNHAKLPQEEVKKPEDWKIENLGEASEVEAPEEIQEPEMKGMAKEYTNEEVSTKMDL